MSDYISRDAARKMKGIKLCGECGHYDWKKHKCKLGANDESDPRAPFYGDCPLPDVAHVSEWISVEEMLPKTTPCNAGTAYSEAVIVWTDGGKAMVAVWDGIDFLCAADYWEAWGERITHWMPLPKPPRCGAKMSEVEG